MPLCVFMRVLRLISGIAIMLVLGTVAAAVWLIPARGVRNRCLRRIGRAWARAMLRLLRIRVHLDPPDTTFSGPALYVANHTGYLDILVLMSVAPGIFISRQDVVWWPLIGQLAALGGPLFVNRKNRLNIGPLVEKVRHRLRTGTSVIFFPEATTSSGDGLLPFKSSLFAAAAGNAGEAFPVRPFVSSYRSIGRQPIGPSNRRRVLWFDDTTLVRHAWGLLSAPGIEVVLKVLPERKCSGDRRQFARQLREEMLRELEIPEIGT